MTLFSEPLPGVKVLRPFVFEDARGNFVKPFHENQLAAHGICITVREEFFSTSAAGVLRGMHFQTPPHSHQKLVYCITGSVVDVILDLRKNSPTFGQSAGFELSAANRHIVHIPAGFAHGFYSIEDNSCLIYKTNAVHAPANDGGILWDSFGFQWKERASTSVDRLNRVDLESANSDLPSTILPFNPSTGAFAPAISERDSKFPAFANFHSPF
jgi:dTDP-4-dehydrorhamnose 3,5-epimerase